MSGPKLGFIGFGEAGSNIAAGLLEKGLSDITAYALECRTVDGGGAAGKDHDRHNGADAP